MSSFAILIEKRKGAAAMSFIAVIDTETNWEDRVMSVGTVLADGDTFRPLAARYHVFPPECQVGGMYDSVLFLKTPVPPRLCTRQEAMEELCRWLKGHERYEDLHKVAHRAAEIYPFDEWQVWEIDSLIGMSRYKEGLEVYQNTEKLLFDEMGVAPSERLLKRFKLMGERTSQAAGALSDIKERLREKEAAVGAYFCPFPSFVDIYHVFSRMVERSGLSVFVMLCTLDYKADHVSEEKEREKSELLRQAIQSSIRKGDFYTRYNVRQYIVMLIEISQENCPIVSKRIAKKFNKLSGDKKFTQVDFYVASIGEMCEMEG